MAKVARTFRVDDPAAASILEMQLQPRIVGEKTLPMIRDVPLVNQIERQLNLFGVYPQMEGKQVFVAPIDGPMSDPYFEQHTLPYVKPGPEFETNDDSFKRLAISVGGQSLYDSYNNLFSSLDDLIFQQDQANQRNQELRRQYQESINRMQERRAYLAANSLSSFLSGQYPEV